MAGTVELERRDPPAAGGGGAGACDRGPAPAPFRPDDVVPLFRPDLRVTRGASPGLFEVLDPASGKRFTLYEFELAVARMLDGRRKVSDVVESGVRLGIPVDVPGLHKFARQMWHYGFLERPGARREAGDGADATWEDRERWDEATRTLYQTGLRLMRLGRSADATGYFEAVLDAQPGNAEATEMLALIAQGASLAATPLGAPRDPAMPAAPVEPAAWRPSGRAVLAVAVLGAVAGAAWLAGMRGRGRPPEPPATPAAAPAPSQTIAPGPPAAAQPPAEPDAPCWRSMAVEARRHPSLADVVAPGAGTVRWSKRSGAAVRAGERLGAVRVEMASARRPDLARKVAELERLTAQDPVYADFLEKARVEQRRAARGRSRLVPLVAPASGELVRPADAPENVGEGAALAAIADSDTWHLDVAAGAEVPPGDAACEVVGDAPGERAPCRVVEPPEGGAAGPGRARFAVEVSSSSAPWLGGARSPLVRVASPGAPPAPPAPSPGAAR